MTASLVVFCVLLTGLAAFQVALIAGAPWGEFAWGGADRVLPPAKRRGSVAAIAIYLVMAAIMVLKAFGVASGAAAVVVEIAAWIVFGYLALSVVTNAMSKSSKERWTMTPVSAALALSALPIAMG